MFVRIGERVLTSSSVSVTLQDQLRVKTQELEACAGELALYRERTNTLTQECSGLTERLDRLHTQFAQLKEVYDEVLLLLFAIHVTKHWRPDHANNTFLNACSIYK